MYIDLELSLSLTYFYLFISLTTGFELVKYVVSIDVYLLVGGNS